MAISIKLYILNWHQDSNFTIRLLQTRPCFVVIPTSDWNMETRQCSLLKIGGRYSKIRDLGSNFWLMSVRWARNGHKEMLYWFERFKQSTPLKIYISCISFHCFEMWDEVCCIMKGYSGLGLQFHGVHNATLNVELPKGGYASGIHKFSRWLRICLVVVSELHVSLDMFV